MAGYLMLNTEQYYYEPFDVLNLRMLDSDTKIGEMAQIAFDWFVAKKTKRGFNDYQEVRVYCEGADAGDFRVYLSSFVVKELDKWTVHRPECIEPGLYLVYGYGDGTLHFYFKIEDGVVSMDYIRVE